MGHFCYSCGFLNVDKKEKLSRHAVCEKCMTDLHCCFNCKFYDSTAYNECHEPNAERVLDKQKSNFCDYFEWGLEKSLKVNNNNEDKKKAIEALNKLFK